MCLFSSRILDLSFNRIPKVEGLQTLTKLKKLFLIHNKIHKMENVDHLVHLEMLEFGSNKIRVSIPVANEQHPIYRCYSLQTSFLFYLSSLSLNIIAHAGLLEGISIDMYIRINASFEHFRQ